MRKLILLLLAVQLLAASLGSLPETEGIEPTPTTPSASAAPEAGDGLSALLERIVSEYDPAAAGTVGALRWAEKLLSAWEESGEDAEAAHTAAAAVDPLALRERLPRLRWAAETLCSGADLGLMNEPGHKSDWTGADVGRLFAALYEGAGITENTEE